MSRPRALLFDLGQVLVAYDWEPAVRTLAARLDGVTVDDLRAWLSEAGGPVDQFGSGRIGESGLLASIHERFDPERRLDDDWLVGVWNSIFNPIGGAMELVDALRPQCRLGLVSNTNPLHFEHLDRSLQLRARFDAVAPSHEVGALKPDPAIWRHALRQLDVDPGDAFFTDDMEDYVRAARSLGMRARRHESLSGLSAALREMGFRVPD